jgi:hypothetical protein
MSKGIRILALVASMIGAGANMAIAQELRSTNQVPGLLGQRSDEITITNTNLKAVNIVYWDGDWKPIEIVPNGKVSLKGQADGLRVRFNDGVAAQSVILKDLGGSYAVTANEQGRWVIKPYEEVAGGDTGLRSR